MNSLDFTNNRFTSSCHKGSKEGENINYTYCQNLQYSKTTQEVSKEGIIGKEIKENYKVGLVLKPEGNWEFKEGMAVKKWRKSK